MALLLDLLEQMGGRIVPLGRELKLVAKFRSSSAYLLFPFVTPRGKVTWRFAHINRREEVLLNGVNSARVRDFSAEVSSALFGGDQVDRIEITPIPILKTRDAPAGMIIMHCSHKGESDASS